MIIKYKLYLVVLFIAFLSSCSRNFQQKINISKAENYLQSINLKDKQLSNYGYSKENPIILKLSPKFGDEKIIELYINRLWQIVGNQDEKIIQKFTIGENGEFILPHHTKKNSDSIYYFRIISKDKSIEKVLYFELKKGAKRFYVPEGLGYSLLSG